MRRIDTPDGLYHNAAVLDDEPGTIVTAEALNAIQEEIVAVILAAGAALDPADNAQLLAAIQAITGAGVTWGAIKNKPATATRWPTWSEVDDKPATFAPSAHTHVINDVTGLQNALDAKATPAQITAAINALVNSAPGALDTLKELADALGDDPNFATTVTNALALKADKTSVVPKTGGGYTGGISVTAAGGGTIASYTGVAATAPANFYMGYSNGATRWGMGLGTAVEFALYTYDAAGEYIGNPLKVTQDGGMSLAANNAPTQVLSLSATGSHPYHIALTRSDLGKSVYAHTDGTSFIITSATVRATGTIMAAGGFQIG